jgi:C4-dicarboxylate-specific signal transduction histidine kinase
VIGKGKGAGLGLAIVSRIMATLHGSVSVTEAPGGGAAFKLAFPPVDMLTLGRRALVAAE